MVDDVEGTSQPLPLLAALAVPAGRPRRQLPPLWYDPALQLNLARATDGGIVPAVMLTGVFGKTQPVMPTEHEDR